MSAWTIEALPLYGFASPGPEVLFQRDFARWVEMVIYAFLLRDGYRTVLVDSGLPRDFQSLNNDIRGRKGPAAGFHPIGDRLCDRLRHRAIAPTAIVLTSFGPYAAGGLQDFPDQSVYVAARGVADLVEPEEPALRHPLGAELQDRLLRSAKVIGETELFPGLTMVEMGIHHPASAALIVTTADGCVAIADPIFIGRNFIEGVALGAAENAGGWHRAVRLLGERADAVIPIHDKNPRPVMAADWHASIRPRGRRT